MYRHPLTWQPLRKKPPVQTQPVADTPLGRHTPRQIPLGRRPPRQTPPAQCMLEHTPLPSACWDTHHPPPSNACWDTHLPAQCMLGYTLASPIQCLLGYTPPAQCMLGYTLLPVVTAADGTLPTGMHSCVKNTFWDKCIGFYMCHSVHKGAWCYFLSGPMFLLGVCSGGYGPRKVGMARGGGMVTGRSMERGYPAKPQNQAVLILL